MDYCCTADLEAAFSFEQISGWSQDVPDRVASAIADAAAEIDGYLASGGYQVPLKEVPGNIKKYACDLAMYSLLSAAGVAEEDWRDTLLDRSKAARRYLEGVASGRFRVPALEGKSSPAKAKKSARYRCGAKMDLSGR